MEQVSHIQSPVTGDLLNEKPVKNLTRNQDPDPDENGAGSVGVGGGGSGLTVTDQPAVVVKRKRGRPRKYDVVQGENMMRHVSSPPPAPGLSSSVSGGGSVKRSRGRPKGSGKLQLLASLGKFLSFTSF